MTPSGDMPGIEAQEQSFSLANMVPQAPMLNRGVWERIESAVRRLARREGERYVVTGPVFQGGDLQALHGRVLVPSATYEAIYDPAANTAGPYICTNTNEPECRVTSVAELAALTGIDPFPAVAEAVKVVAARLPRPRVLRKRSRDGGENDRMPGQDPFAGAR